MNSTPQSSRRKQGNWGPMTLNMLGTKDGLSTMVHDDSNHDYDGCGPYATAAKRGGNWD